jgi:glycosyltransferase involved in cell wall biosynthesis
VDKITANLVVLMPVYNAELFVAEAIQSLLSQSFSNFKLLIINDASTDNTLNICESFLDNRIIIYSNTQNLGLTKCLNQGLNMIEATYIARADADDTYHPDRFLLQLDFLKENSEVGVCGTFANIFGVKNQIYETAVTDAEIKSRLLFTNPIVHISVVFRAELLKNHNLYYDEDFLVGQDYDFWVKISSLTKFYNLPIPLVNVRTHNQRVTEKRSDLLLQNFNLVRSKQLISLGVEDCIINYLNLHHEIVNTTQSPISYYYYFEVNNWLSILKKANEEKKIYSEPEFTNLLEQIWLKTMAGNTHLGLKFGKLFASSSFSPYRRWNTWQKIKFWLKCIFKKR